MSAPARDGINVVATNRQARRNYDVLDSFEAGVVLRGSEVKSLRESKVSLTDTYARIVGGELWLIGLHVSPYSHAAAHSGHQADRDRKLLVHRKELELLARRVDIDRLQLVPLSLYFKDGRAKIEIAVARGRKVHDKRQAIAERDADRDTQRALAERRRQD
ncbi:MAG TPA: SsrA-binding protein SmpB [Acidimicrobiales bacterium]|jgi:SsrA-binding protein|nr:SsrA-binding protein SmpB [Acidimicrobiales bacterium]